MKNRKNNGKCKKLTTESLALALPATHFYHERLEDHEEKRRVLTAD
jgi:hypothetical protein